MSQDFGSLFPLEPLKYLVSKIGSGKTPSGGAASYVDDGIPFLRSQNIHNDGLRLDDIAYISNDVDREMRATRTQAGDVLLNITGASLGRVAVVPASLARANVNQHVCIIRCRQSLEPGFLWYVLQSQVGAAQIFAQEQGISREGLNFEQIGALRVPMLVLGRQRAIVSFLDRKTSAIDALIAKKERLIELLAEKRQALITQAVTKGLDPNVPMKDSGIDWLGEIPAHWTLRRLKHLGQIRSGIAKGRDVAGKETSALPYLRVANVQNGWLDLEDVATIEVTREEARRYALRPGDVLMNEGGDFDKLGRGYVWEGQIEGCIHQNHVFAVRLWRSVNPYWVNLATQASYLRHFFILRSKQSTNLASISSSNLGEAPIPMPPEREVNALLAHVLAQLERLDEVRDKIATHLDKLREYRQALITAAVTGKLDLSKEAA